MSEIRTWRGHPVLSRPLAILGVERRWFVLSTTLGLAIWVGVDSSLSALVVFVALFSAGRLSARHDPDMLSILKESSRYRPRYDPGKWPHDPWHIVIREGKKPRR